MGNFRRMLGWVGAALLGAAVFTVSENSRADAAEVLRPSTRPAWWAGGAGFNGYFAGRFCGSFGCGGGNGFLGSFSFTNEFGYHLLKGGDGPAIGGIIILGFGAFDAVRFSPQFKFWWDIPVKKEYAIFLTPGASIGFNMLAGGGQVFPGFGSQITFAGRLVIKDRGLVFLQPVTLDISGVNASGNFGVAVGYSVIAGGGVTFP